jgi:hypothetical protein
MKYARTWISASVGSMLRADLPLRLAGRFLAEVGTVAAFFAPPFEGALFFVAFIGRVAVICSTADFDAGDSVFADDRAAAAVGEWLLDALGTMFQVVGKPITGGTIFASGFCKAVARPNAGIVR